MKKEKIVGNAVIPHEHKAFKFNLEDIGESGEFSGYAAVFDEVDTGGDVIEKGAFTKTIQEDFDRIKILSQHQDDELPIGKPLELREDDKGLFIRAKISDTQKGRDIQTLLKDGVLNELSIGYDAVDFYYDGDSHIRHLKEVRLWEVSVVTWAMNNLAQISEVKSLVENLQLEAKSGKLSRSKLESLKPFIAVVKELADILSPLLETLKLNEEQLSSNSGIQNNTKQTKKANMVFNIINTRRKIS